VADALAETVRVLDEVAALRGRLRQRRGAIDFATREAKVLLDEHGVPQAVKVRARTRATSLIEEAMLMANEAVATLLVTNGLSSAYRVHERPSPEHLLQTVPLLRELELLEPGEVDPLVAGDPFVVQRILERAQGTRLEQVVDATLLRAQKRAIYLPHNEGHYALGARAYCHFTSPIRRYPDVVAHRTLKALLADATESREQRKVAKLLPQLLRTCSERERVADAAARDSQKVKMAEYFSTHVGERFAGVVSGCMRSGLFVTLDETCAEGFLPVRALGEEWFAFDEARMSLTGSESGRSYRPGTRVVVEVAATNPPRGQIDFRLPGPRDH
jgi:ribonuclease R